MTMPNECVSPVTVRLPVELHARLRDAAVRDRRSVNAETIVLLDAALEQTDREDVTTR
jgi:hypothetical protein